MYQVSSIKYYAKKKIISLRNTYYKIHNTNQRGLSVLEVILASAIFITFASAAAVTVIQGLNSNRQGAEFTVATQYAAEGLEAVKSIKNQAYSNLQNIVTNKGVQQVGGVWQFKVGDPSEDTIVHNISDNFRRQIKIEPVNRSGTPPAGDIVSPGGTLDPDTKKVTSTVLWNFNSSRPETISLISYLSDWRKPISQAGDALAIYGDTTSVARPRYRTYDNSSNGFIAENSTGTSLTDTIVGKNFFVQTNPFKLEAVAGYVNNSGVLRIMCFDGSTWTSEWTVTVGGTGTNDGRFGIAFEKTSGDALVVYSNNTATNEMAYRTKPGSTGCGTANWAAATNIEAVRTTGIVHWIRMENSSVSGSNNIALAWADANSDLSSMIWTGAGWTIAEPTAAIETELERVTASQDVLSFDIAYESTSGNLMVVWGLNGTTCTAVATETTTLATSNCIRYKRYTTSWQATTVMRTVADRATNIDIAANPNTNELILAATDNSQADLSLGYWSGTAPWTGQANADIDTTVVAAGNKLVATGWLISGGTTRGIVVYSNADTTGTPPIRTLLNARFVQIPMTTTPAAGTEPSIANSTLFDVTPDFATSQRWFKIDMDPNDKDRLMVTLSDNNSDLFAKRLVMTSTPTFTWTNSDGSAALENSLGQATSRPFGFVYWRNP